MIAESTATSKQPSGGASPQKGEKMKAETYFKKHGEIYGIEVAHVFTGGVVQVERFDDLEKAKAWATSPTKYYRFLGTKSDSKNTK